MTLRLEVWEEMLSTVKLNNSIDILEQIKTKLKERDGKTYQEWKKADFDKDHLFNTLLILGPKELTLLFIAIENGHIEVASALIEKGADPNSMGLLGGTSLYLAIEKGHIEIASALIEKGADPNLMGLLEGTSLNAAIANNHTEIVNALIEKGANLNMADENAYTPLHVVVIGGCIDLANTLIEKGADLNAADKNGYTPLHLAMICHRTDMIKFLIKKGADLNIVDRNGCNPFNEAASNAFEFCYRFTHYYGFDWDGYADSRRKKGGNVFIKYALLKNCNLKKPYNIHADLSSYWKECQDEIQRKVHKNVTLHDILTADGDLLAFYISNKNIREALKLKVFVSIYADEIMNYLQKVEKIARSDLLDNMRIMCAKHSGSSATELPEEMCEEIAKYLDDTDILNLNYAVEVELARSNLLDNIRTMCAKHSGGTATELPEEICEEIAKYLDDTDTLSLNYAVGNPAGELSNVNIEDSRLCVQESSCVRTQPLMR